MAMLTRAIRRGFATVSLQVPDRVNPCTVNIASQAALDALLARRGAYGLAPASEPDTLLLDADSLTDGGHYHLLTGAAGSGVDAVERLDYSLHRIRSEIQGVVESDIMMAVQIALTNSDIPFKEVCSRYKLLNEKGGVELEVDGTYIKASAAFSPHEPPHTSSLLTFPR